jgi:hypothetical protein
MSKSISWEVNIQTGHALNGHAVLSNDERIDSDVMICLAADEQDTRRHAVNGRLISEHDARSQTSIGLTAKGYTLDEIHCSRCKSIFDRRT